jgi:formate dehydrogenase subunit gamma
VSTQPKLFVRRYLPVQRFLHWMGVFGFLLLLVTGSVLVWPRQVPVGMCCALRQLHRLGAILYALWPILYAVLHRHGLREFLKESFTFTRDDLAWFKHIIPYFFGRTRGLPPQGRVNAGQKLQHIGVIVLSLAMGASGVVLLLGAGRLGPNALAITATIHDLGMLGLAVLMVGHVYFTLLYGGLDAMLKGYVSVEYARMEHPKWLASLPDSAYIDPSQPKSAAKTESVEPTDAKT